MSFALLRLAEIIQIVKDMRLGQYLLDKGHPTEQKILFVSVRLCLRQPIK